MQQLQPRALGRVRKEKGMTRAELARAAGLQAGTITWIETGRFVPYESQLAKIAGALGVADPSALLEPEEVAE